MALPAIFRRLFRDNGYSSILKPEIIPFATSASSNAADVAASTSWVRTATNGYINGLSISGRTITYTKGNGTTGTITTQDTNTTYSAATQNADGLMSAADKKKLDGMDAGAGKYTLFATWTFSNDNMTTKTVTGCTAGKPIIICHCPVGSSGYCYVGVIAGAADAKSGTNAYVFGTMGDHGAASNRSMVIVPNAATVTMTIGNAKDDKIYVYK